VPTKTQILSDKIELAGMMSLYLQHRPGPAMEAQSERIYLSFGGVLLAIEQVAVETGPVITCPVHPANAAEYNVAFHYYIQTPGVSGGVVAEDTIEEGYIDVVVGDDDGLIHSISLPFTAEVGWSRLWRSEILSKGMGRDGTPVYADDVAYSDQWINESPAPYSFTLGGLSYSGTQVWDEGFGLWVPELQTIFTSSILFGFEQWWGNNAGVYMAFENVILNGIPIPFARYYYGTAMPTGPIYIDGVAGGWDLYCNMAEVAPVWNHEIEYTLGLQVDFSRFSVRDRDGSLLDDARVSGGFQATNHVPATLDWSATP